MPDTDQDRELEQLLGFRAAATPDEFVLGVMQRVQRERRRRRLILFIFGLTGAAFGVAGAMLLSDPITRFFTGLPLTGTMQAALIVSAAVAFYGWIMNEDVSLAN
jgi:hypothetical protein